MIYNIFLKRENLVIPQRHYHVTPRHQRYSFLTGIREYKVHSIKYVNSRGSNPAPYIINTTSYEKSSFSHIVPRPNAAKLEYFIYVILTLPMLRRLLTRFSHLAYLAFNLWNIIYFGNNLTWLFPGDIDMVPQGTRITLIWPGSDNT